MRRTKEVETEKSFSMQCIINNTAD